MLIDVKQRFLRHLFHLYSENNPIMMKLIKQLSALSVLILFLACTSSVSSTDEPITETPDVLSEGELKQSYRGFSRESYQGIVDQLYTEALEKDPELKAFDDEIEAIYDLKKENTEATQRYIRLNADYWSNFRSHTESIKDTLLRQQVLVFIDKLQDDYDESMKPFHNKLSEINAAELSLQDYETMHKLLVTYPMMANYQRNEKPKMAELNVITVAQKQGTAKLQKKVATIK